MRRALIVILFLILPAPSWAQSGTLIPWVAEQFTNDSGDPVALGKLCSYAAGTSTPQATYSDVNLTTANANPVMLGADGRPTSGAIYVRPISYKFVLRTAGADNTCSTGTIIWTYDNVTYGVSVDYGPCQGRLTLTSGTPVTSADVTGATTLYFSPWRGNRCALYDSTFTYWVPTTFSELSISNGGLSNSTNYDVFVYSNAGTPTLELTAWSSGTARATAIVLQDGVYVKTGATTRRYLGTVRTNSSGQFTDSYKCRCVWNAYNRVLRTLRLDDATASWTYTTAVVRQANNSAANQVEFVVGLAEANVQMTLQAVAASTAAGTDVGVGISQSVATSVISYGGVATSSVANGYVLLTASVNFRPSLGYTLLLWVEYSEAAGTTTWYGDAVLLGASGAPFIGMSGTVEG